MARDESEALANFRDGSKARDQILLLKGSLFERQFCVGLSCGLQVQGEEGLGKGRKQAGM